MRRLKYLGLLGKSQSLVTSFSYYFNKLTGTILNPSRSTFKP